MLDEGPDRRRHLAPAIGQREMHGQAEIRDRFEEDAGLREVLHGLRHDGDPVPGGSKAGGRNEILDAILEAWREPARLPQGSQREAEPFLVGKLRHDERLIGKLPGRNRSAPGQRVVACHRSQQPFCLHDLRLDARRAESPRPDDPHIDPAFAQRVELAWRLHRKDFDPHQFVMLAEVAQHPRQEPGADTGGDVANPDNPRQPPGSQPADLVGTLDVAQCRFRFRVEQPPGIRQRDRLALVAVQQRDAKVLLQPLHLGTQARLGEAQAIGGLGKVKFLGDRQETLQLTYI
ncbi:hypothetical protein CBM2587_B10229 [Cupriavidus taiwanensis]|uniref:Uncharacterized protein n=1 Tax=Cupriavidus taiwanensis TaxID=164546 RepID=A0A375BXJ9_9BURK|nr:hypothetical protein CBM2587_B10229 [Cupriavidus taiwanensis]